MTDQECVAFLREVLPRMGLRWDGYRNLRRQVCKRIARRMRELGVEGVPVFRSYLDAHPEEWTLLRQLCRVTTSRFYRDQGIFLGLEVDVLPRLAEAARQREDQTVAVLCAGCAGGEEAYTLSLVWHCRVVATVGGTGLSVLATDIDEQELERARAGLFPRGALRELPPDLLHWGFDEAMDGLLRIRDAFRDGLTFRWSDLTLELPAGPFDLILCRNLAFTYFGEALQVETARRLASRMTLGGVLVVGAREKVPAVPELTPLPARDGFYVRAALDP